MRTLRNIFRHKLRAALTIFGIAIGVFALVVMGSLAEKMTLLVQGGTDYYADKVVVVPGDAMAALIGAAPMSVELADDIAAVDGVAAVAVSAGLTLEEEIDAVNFGLPAQIAGEDTAASEYESFEIRLAEGRAIESGERGVAVVGSDLVDQLDAKVGETVVLRGQDFEVVGIAEKTLTSPDTTVQVPLEDAQELFHDSLPDAIKGSVEAEDLATSIVVYPESGVDPDELAEDIGNEFDSVSAVGPEAFEEQVRSQIGIFSTMVYAIALIALLVGGLSVVNTMTMSVSERTREIGIRKAIGATDGAVMRQFVGEAAVIGLIGGLVGLALGSLLVYASLASTTDPSSQIFLLTPRLATSSVLFALGLGIVSGLYPAWHASRMNPVQALRYE
jgi:putative ABC transport system permease protein